MNIITGTSFSMVIHGVPSSYNALRDMVWPNLRHQSITKMDRERQPGAEPQTFDELDDMVLKIIGKESPTIIGLNVKEKVNFKVPVTSVEPNWSFVIRPNPNSSEYWTEKFVRIPNTSEPNNTHSSSLDFDFCVAFERQY